MVFTAFSCKKLLIFASDDIFHSSDTDEPIFTIENIHNRKGTQYTERIKAERETNT
jgi:hypothetical protein